MFINIAIIASEAIPNAALQYRVNQWLTETVAASHSSACDLWSFMMAQHKSIMSLHTEAKTKCVPVQTSHKTHCFVQQKYKKPSLWT